MTRPILLTFLLLLSAPAAWAADAEPTACLAPGAWAVPAGAGTTGTSPDLLAAAVRESHFVLLGEAHDSADDHRWQLHALGMLLAERGKLVLGFEMFPRRVQPVLDRWVAGELTEKELLQDSDWDSVWGFDPDLYMPLFEFARLQRVPMVALNVERSLIGEVGKRGWAAIPPARREGVGDPAPASPAYLEQLRPIHGMHAGGDDDDAGSFQHFVEGQLVWDRAFAEALDGAARAHPGALVVGIIGSGHLRDGHGVPYQLRAMGHQRVIVWMPVPAQTPCSELTSGLADAVFAVDRRPEPPRLRLGVVLQDDDTGPRIREVVSGSVADNAGVRQGDRVVSAAGRKMSNASDVVATIRRQAPGTWLPLEIERDGQKMNLVAKFPTDP